VTKNTHSKSARQWRLMDLHLHTPASNDYQEPKATYLDILRRSRARGLDIIAFADHNTVAGYRKMREELERLELLESLDRLTDAERSNLKEFRTLLKEILVLPGFEFTATFGFHILGIFSPDKTVRELEHLLLDLKVPPQELDDGSSTVGATADVLTAYRLIDEAGGLVIAAHANSSNGVAMRGFRFGGQTKIAYTQDPHLHALEVTDLDQKGRRATSQFFNGTKPEYPRRMHCIQGSDAHRLAADPKDKKNLGIGDRGTEVMLDVVSFDALYQLFQSNDFASHRPNFATKSEPALDFVQQALEEGSSIVQDFHESMTTRGGKLYAIIADVCGMANTNGGTVYVGMDADTHKAPTGVNNPKEAISKLEKEIAKRISPPLACHVDSMETRGKTVIRILVPRGSDPPYAVDDNKIYVRDEAETGLAVRDEIKQLVLRRQAEDAEPQPEVPQPDQGVAPPRTGVEVVDVEERDNTRYYTLRDLRNGNVVKNVTESSARRLWHYAISEFKQLPREKLKANITWVGDLGRLKEQKRGNRRRYDLVQRLNGQTRFYYGVTEDGIHGEWKKLVGGETE
jgi:hypothetical protein